jgi:hypothetical protein
MGLMIRVSKGSVVQLNMGLMEIIMIRYSGKGGNDIIEANKVEANKVDP